MFAAESQLINAAPDWLTPPSFAFDRVKAVDCQDQDASLTARQIALFTLLRQAKLFHIVVKIRQCGKREQQRRCGCGSELGIVKRYCHHYFCAECQRYKSYRVSQQTKEAIAIMRQKNPGLKVFFGTFTLPSCTAADVKTQMSALNNGFTRLMKRVALKKYTIGAVRFTEIGFNRSTGMFNPHLHAVVVMRATYMSKGYLSESALLEMWRCATKCQRVSQVKFKMIKPDQKCSLSLETKVAGLVRYAMKPIKLEDWTPMSLAILNKAIRNRRLCEFLGEFKPIRKQQKQNQTRCVCQHCMDQHTG